MSTDTATRNNRSKRTRIDPTVRILQTEQAPPEPKAPKALAIAFVKSHSASLQPQVGSILERLGTQHLNLLSKRHQKTVQITKMEQNKDFIPRSARIEFSFHMTKEAMESPDFQTLQTNTEAKIQEFRHFLKRQIIDATKLEETVLLHQIQDDFIHALRHVIHTFLTANSVPITPTNIQATIKTIISDQLLFKHCKLTPETFVQRANTILPDLFDSPSQTTTEPMDHSDSLVIQGYTPYNPGLINPTGTNSPNQTVPLPVELNHITQTIKQAFKAIFVTAWDQFLDQVQKNRITHELSKLNTTVFDAPATEKAATILDNEVSADRATLDALIVEKTQAVTKQLTQQIKQLNDKLATLQKTTQRGAEAAPPAKTKMPPPLPNDPQGHLVATKVVKTTAQNHLHHHHLLPPLVTTIEIGNVLETKKPTTTTTLPETTTETTPGRIRKNGAGSQKRDKTINPSVPIETNTLLWFCC